MAENDVKSNLNDMINEDFYIAPDTEMYILRGVPLDNTYEHTITWENLDYQRKKQRDYFITKAKIRVLKQSYQRVDREWFKVYVSADDLYDCNYIMFRNTAFNPNKWWYAFLLEVEYINNNTAKIRYEIDVMQTWLPGLNMDYQIMPCFIERCHSASDDLYENLVPENIVNYNEYVVDEIKEFDMNRMAVVIYSTEYYNGTDWQTAGVKNVFGTLQSVHYEVFIAVNNDGSPRYDVLDQITQYLSQYVTAGKTDSILSIQMCPVDMIGHEKLQEWSVKLTPPAKSQKIGGEDSYFVPKNAKLYSYPFNQIKVNNESGDTKVYKWELFDKKKRGEFVITGTDYTVSSAITYPVKYKGISKNMEDSLSFTSFPICPWSSDAYKAWWAQNTARMNSDAFGGLASIAAIVVGAATQNPMLVATGVGGVVSSATKIGTSLYEAKHQASQSHGSLSNTFILPAIKNVKFVFTKESLRPEMLQIYDDYFTRYGYAQKRVMFPRLVARKRWTYVQTVGFEFNGQINDTDTKKIKSIFDNGITFWRNPNDVGHYELSNDPLV